MNIPELTLDPGLRPRLQLGHPWVYRNHIHGAARLRSGQWVRLRCGGFSAYGLYDATSAIAVRIFSRDMPPDDEWIAERVWEAWENRAPLRDATPATSAYRWIYGEGDSLPGLIVDRYGDYALIQIYAESLESLVAPVARALRQCDPELRGVLVRSSQIERDDEESEVGASARRVRVLFGEEPPADLVVQEHGLFFHADVQHGQKTGLFLDHRENRRMIEGLAGGRRVLNCFSYTGAFSLYALRGGAAEVVSNDIGQGLAEAATANIGLNKLDARRHTFVTEDSFALLDAYAKAGRSFDLVVLDPPSFARSKSNLHAALRAYTRINSLALRCVELGGLIATASCTSQVGPEAFRTMLGDAAAQSGRRVQIIHEAGQPLDHPVPAAFPEGRYLKFIVARVLDTV